ncbi:VOC family protein [Bacillus sp. JCM 19041]|uniref:VOC family protein n=1 Tax=Bacillus sp. JCM 19041 TaxID=1460637 RepID=UPI0006D09FE9
MKLNNIRLLVSQFEKCFSFYQDILGLKPTWGDKHANYASFDAGNNQIIALFNQEAMAEAVGTSSYPKSAKVQDTVALIFEVDDLEASVTHLQERGATFTDSIQERPLWGLRTVHLRDPEGHLIELYTSLPEKAWDQSLVEDTKKYK